MNSFMIYAVKRICWLTEERFKIFKLAATQELAEQIIEDDKKQIHHSFVEYCIEEYEVMTE